jgi:hypothetical protein
VQSPNPNFVLAHFVALILFSLLSRCSVRKSPSVPSLRWAFGFLLDFFLYGPWCALRRRTVRGSAFLVFGLVANF